MLGHTDFLFGLYITFQVMAITEMSPRYQDAVASLFKRLDNKQRIDPSRAHDPYGSNVGWILQPGYTGQIRSGIRAPVAQKRYDFRFEIPHFFPFERFM
jgi:hypothetical protein